MPATVYSGRADDTVLCIPTWDEPKPTARVGSLKLVPTPWPAAASYLQCVLCQVYPPTRCAGPSPASSSNPATGRLSGWLLPPMPQTYWSLLSNRAGTGAQFAPVPTCIRHGERGNLFLQSRARPQQAFILVLTLPNQGHRADVLGARTQRPGFPHAAEPDSEMGEKGSTGTGGGEAGLPISACSHEHRWKRIFQDSAVIDVHVHGCLTEESPLPQLA